MIISIYNTLYHKQTSCDEQWPAALSLHCILRRNTNVRLFLLLLVSIQVIIRNIEFIILLLLISNEKTFHISLFKACKYESNEIGQETFYYTIKYINCKQKTIAKCLSYLLIFTLVYKIIKGNIIKVCHCYLFLPNSVCPIKHIPLFVFKVCIHKTTW